MPANTKRHPLITRAHRPRMSTQVIDVGVSKVVTPWHSQIGNYSFVIRPMHEAGEWRGPTAEGIGGAQPRASAEEGEGGRVRECVELFKCTECVCGPTRSRVRVERWSTYGYG